MSDDAKEILRDGRVLADDAKGMSDDAKARLPTSQETP